MDIDNLTDAINNKHECQICGEFTDIAAYDFDNQACNDCVQSEMHCPTCHGTGLGMTDAAGCYACRGRGY